MKLIGNQISPFSPRRIVVAALLASIAFAPSLGFAASPDARADRTEMRIKDMHAKLRITEAQEPQWAKVSDAMRADAKNMDTLTQGRGTRAKEMNAVENLKSYSEISDAHADGIKKLVPVFSDLYATMSDVQKKEADTLFRHRGIAQNSHKHGRKTMHKKAHRMSSDQ